MYIIQAVIVCSLLPLQPEKTDNDVHPSVYSDIRQLSDEAERLRELYGRLEAAPTDVSMWQPFTSSKSEINGRIDTLTESVEKMLLPDDYQDFTGQYNRTADRITEKERYIAELKQRQLSAPTERYMLDPVTVTKKAIDSYIADAESDIEELRAKLHNLRSEYSDLIEDRYGIILTPEQLDALMVRADGDDILRSSVVVGAMGELMRGLERSLDVTGENTEMAEKYYGMVVLSYETLVRLWENHHDKYANEWYPRLEQLEQDNAEILERTERELRRVDSEPNRIALEKSLENNRYFSQAIGRYRDELVIQEKQVRRALSQAEENLRVAKITLDTVSIAGSLRSMIETSRNEFDTLLDLQLPTIRPFENEQMKSEYYSITSEINSLN